SKEDYNFILLTFDALRADSLGIYGGTTKTPSFDNFGNENIVFLNAHSLAPWTVPSMVGLFSSQFPSKLSIGNSKDYYTIPENVDTLAELLDKRGYRTGAFVGNYLLQKSTGILQGFDFSILVNHHTRTMNRFALIMPFLESALSLCIQEPEYKYLMNTSKYLVENTINFIRKNRNKKFFLWVHFVDPHDPYAPPQEFRKKDVEEKWPVFAPMDPSLPYPQLSQIRMGKVALTDSDKEYIRELYNGEVLYMDKLFGNILQTLKDEKLLDNTVICVTSDHGEEFWDHGDYYHGQSLYEELIKVPLIISIPRIRSPKKIYNPVSTIDLMPTFFEIAGIPISKEFDGKSLMPFIKGEYNAAEPPIFAEETYYYEKKKAVIDGNYKLIFCMDSKKLELFDLSTDPYEKINIADKNPLLVKDMKKLLIDWIKKTKKKKKGYKETKEDLEKKRNQLNRMKALGYVN
ncbi:MAG: DUF229 domain-containing protein, partial [Candidatus Schekmanbacteria bacterium]